MSHASPTSDRCTPPHRPDPIAHSVSLQRLLAQIALAFLLLTQQGGIQHAISHLSESGSGPSQPSQARIEKKQLPGETHCTLCLELAGLGTGLHGDGFRLPAATPHGDAVSQLVPVFLAPPSRRAFDSRAPPRPA